VAQLNPPIIFVQFKVGDTIRTFVINGKTGLGPYDVIDENASEYFKDSVVYFSYYTMTDPDDKKKIMISRVGGTKMETYSDMIFWQDIKKPKNMKVFYDEFIGKFPFTKYKVDGLDDKFILPYPDIEEVEHEIKDFLIKQEK